MPNWKKVIVSGSNAILNNITASGDISASGNIYATNFYGNFEGTIDSASHATEALVSGINSPGFFSVLFSNNNVLFKDSDSGDFTYNPNSNTLTVENISGTASLATLANTASIAEKVELSDFISGGTLDLLVGTTNNILHTVADNNLTYNFDTNTLNVPNLEGTASVSTTSSYSNTISISNDFNNRIITTNGDSTLNAEQNLSFNGSTLELTGSLTVDANNPITIKGQVGNVITVRDEGSTDIIKIGDVDSNDGETLITINDNSNTITLNATNKLDINANIDASNYNITASIITASSFIGNLTGTSTLASNLTGTPNIVVNNITASGDISASGDLYSTHVFIPQGINTGDAGLIFGDTIAGNSGYIADNDGRLVIGYNDSDKLSIGDDNEALLLAGNTRITGHITASNNISSSGDIIANNGSFSGNLTVDGNITANQYIVSSSVTYMTQSFSSGSTIFGDTQDDTHQFTGSVDITGSLSIPGFTDVSASLASKGNANITGTPLDNQIAVFTNSNTIEGNSNFTYNGTQLSLEGGAIFNTSNDDVAFQFKGSSDNNLLQVNPQSGDKVGIGTSTPSEKLTVEGNISASGYVSADYLILNPNTTTTGSNDTETQINISLGDEEYKRGVIKRVFDWRENLASANDIDINNQVIADVGEFSRAIIHTNIELKGYRNHLNSFSLLQVTGSINQMINITGTNPNYTTTTSGQNYIEFIYEGDGATNAPPLFRFIGNEGTNTPEDTIIHVINNKIKFNIPSSTVNTVNSILSSSLTTVTLDYQLFK